MVSSIQRPMIITPDVKDLIDKLVAHAEAHPVPWEALAGGVVPVTPGDTMRLADRRPGFERPRSEHVLIPMGYRAAFSVEEQPVGLVRHLSLSVEDAGMLPHHSAVRMVADLFGMKHADNVWLEEFDPGHYAVNVGWVWKPHLKS